MSVDFQRHQIANALPPLIESFAPGVTWLNAAFGPGFGGFVFPGSLSSQDGFYGPNLMLTAPEPSTLALLGLGLAGFGFVRAGKRGGP